ncbi:HEAT repeat domain-containing protein [Thermococcus alcaliphilus]|uniref:HEAT repeat domain-containing protein n=1 Tax=Thermococcus alcaliphilus TaxID=139207 RepID=UPI002090A967|nr:hypothetical protein [Thermococcus alcaliphilus]MCO6042158.1 hypothetical protein [Thermococcus alcaliphilus]
MGLFSFGSKKNKIIKMLSEGDLEGILRSAAKDPKYVDAVVELLNEENPGIRGDALLLIGELTVRHKELMMPYVEEGLPITVLSLINDPDPYVKENAMQSFEIILRYFPWVGEKFKNEMTSLLLEILQTGDKNRKAFAILMLGRLKVKEALPVIEEFRNISDTVILPLEGIKWVPLGEIAEKVIKELGGDVND